MSTLQIVVILVAITALNLLCYWMGMKRGIEIAVEESVKWLKKYKEQLQKKMDYEKYNNRENPQG